MIFRYIAFIIFIYLLHNFFLYCRYNNKPKLYRQIADVKAYINTHGIYNYVKTIYYNETYLFQYIKMVQLCYIYIYELNIPKILEKPNNHLINKKIN